MAKRQTPPRPPLTEASECECNGIPPCPFCNGTAVRAEPPTEAEANAARAGYGAPPEPVYAPRRVRPMVGVLGMLAMLGLFTGPLDEGEP